ncbi:MAG: hypothetical protein KGI11_09100 [Thaumarchaeota archaeon]|nr:hypothetical protein [Nitrososphaerota archaeon]
MTDFQIGDEVKFVERHFDYARSQYVNPKHLFTVTKIWSKDGKQRLDLKSNVDGTIAPCWDYRVVLVSGKPRLTKQELLCEKVKQMYAKRKAKGYAF